MEDWGARGLFWFKSTYNYIHLVAVCQWPSAPPRDSFDVSHLSVKAQGHLVTWSRAICWQIYDDLVGRRGGSTVKDVQSYTSVMKIAHGIKKQQPTSTLESTASELLFVPSPPWFCQVDQIPSWWIQTLLVLLVLRRPAVEASRRWWWRWLAEPSTPEPPPSSRSLTTSSQVVFCSAELTLPRLQSWCSGFFCSLLWEDKKCVGRAPSSDRLVDPQSERNEGDNLLLLRYSGYRIQN